MQKTKLITLLKTFSKKEMKDFEKFIASPYFSSGRNLKPLYNTLKKFHPEFNSPNLTEEKIFRKVFPGKKFAGKKSLHSFQVLASGLMLQVEKFLVHNTIGSVGRRYYYNLCLFHSFIDKNFYASAIKPQYNNLELLKKQENDMNYFSMMYEINTNLGYLYYAINDGKKSNEFISNNVLYIIADIFEKFSSHLVWHRKTLEENNIGLKGIEIIKHLINNFEPKVLEKDCDNDTYNTKEVILLNYYYMKSYFNKNDSESVIKALNIFYGFFRTLSKQVIHNKLSQLYSLLMERAKIDDSLYKKAIELFEFTVNRGENRLGLVAYVVNLATITAVMNVSELKRYISKYSSYVEKKYSDEVNNISQIYVDFKEKKFEKCLARISRTGNTILQLKASFYKFKISCFYELNLFEEALNVVDDFEHFLRNNNISEMKKSEDFNLITCFKMLLKASFRLKGKITMDLKRICELTKNTLWGYWFKEKVEELECKKAGKYSCVSVNAAYE